MAREHAPFGTVATTYEQTVKLLPELTDILATFSEFEYRDRYRYDVKINRLESGIYPGIAVLHYDFAPKDPRGRVQLDRIAKPAPLMYLWLSGPPLTEFSDGRPVLAREWIPFTQADLHRSTVATGTGERILIRAVPTSIVTAESLRASGIRKRSFFMTGATTNESDQA